MLKPSFVALCFLLAGMNSVLAQPIKSGLAVGDMPPAYDPTHLWGPDKGTNTCPVCKYGMLPAVQVWIQGEPDASTTALALHLEKATSKYASDKFKVFFVFIPAAGASETGYNTALQNWAQKSQLKNVAVTILNKESKSAHADYKINSKVKSTVLVYSRLTIRSSFVNVSKAADMKKLDDSIVASLRNKTKG